MSQLVRCKSTHKLALTLSRFGQNKPVRTNKDIYTLSSVKTSLLRVNRSNMIYRVTSFNKKTYHVILKGGKGENREPSRNTTISSFKCYACTNHHKITMVSFP